MTTVKHFGVKGMKWGVRNDRSSSGGSNSKPTLTKEEKARAKKMSGAQMTEALRDYEKKTGKKGGNKDDVNIAISDYLKKNQTVGKTAAQKKKKTVSEMSNDDLKKLVDRMDLERRYSALAAQKETKSVASRGRNWVLEVATRSMNDVAVNTVRTQMQRGVNAAIDKLPSLIEDAMRAGGKNDPFS